MQQWGNPSNVRIVPNGLKTHNGTTEVYGLELMRPLSCHALNHLQLLHLEVDKIVLLDQHQGFFRSIFQVVVIIKLMLIST